MNEQDADVRLYMAALDKTYAKLRKHCLESDPDNLTYMDYGDEFDRMKALIDSLARYKQVLKELRLLREKSRNE